MKQLRRSNGNGSKVSKGQLLDDNIVGETVLEGLINHEYVGSDDGGNDDDDGVSFILDGYPRTIEQIRYMKENWPSKYQIQSAIHLNVPDDVCKTKMLGRRFCSKCGAGYNINCVISNGWFLPPKLPAIGHVCNSSNNYDSENMSNWMVEEKGTCDVSIQREDDVCEKIIDERLRIYHSNLDPILKYFQNRKRLLTLTPYNGFEDVSGLVDRLHMWRKEKDC